MCTINSPNQTEIINISSRVTQTKFGKGLASTIHHVQQENTIAFTLYAPTLLNQCHFWFGSSVGGLGTMFRKKNQVILYIIQDLSPRQKKISTDISVEESNKKSTRYVRTARNRYHEIFPSVTLYDDIPFLVPNKYRKNNIVWPTLYTIKEKVSRKVDQRGSLSLGTT